jgi:putative glutamine amidotransferase
MSAKTAPVRVAIVGQDLPYQEERHGCGLWPAGLAASLTAAEADAVPLADPAPQRWEEALEGVHGLVLVGNDLSSRRPIPEAEALCLWCRQQRFPVLAIDHGLHLLNSAFGGTVHNDLPRDLPEALQHRHPPERGLRHAINVLPGTRLAELYGEGEVVVNSEHRRAVHRLARVFKVCAHALDGVIEAVEAVDEDWFALGVQWQPASATASGLDIQLFRGLVEACGRRLAAAVPAGSAA